MEPALTAKLSKDNENAGSVRPLTKLFTNENTNRKNGSSPGIAHYGTGLRFNKG